jgi:hypothetical protein
MSIYEKIKETQMKSRKSKDTFVSNALGGILNEVKPIGNEIKEITDDLIVKTLNKYIKGVNTNIELAEKSGRTELIDGFKNEKKIYEMFLPKQMKDSEIKVVIETIIGNREKNGKMMGEIMGKFNKEYTGQFNPSTLSTIVKEILGS